MSGPNWMGYGKNFILVQRGMDMILDVVVASTSRYTKFGSVRDPDRAEDLSGKVILEKIRTAGIQQLPAHPGRRRAHPAAIKTSSADAMVICGGTGLTALDLTIEAAEPLFEKTPGLGDLSLAEHEGGWNRPANPGNAGVFMKKPIFCLPGSPGRLAWEWTSY